MNVAKLIAELRKGSPIGALIKMAKNTFDDKLSADATYIELRIVLDEFFMKGYRFESESIQAIVAILRELPAAGAKRRNFEKLYLQDIYTLQKLPSHPRDIPYGHWH